MHFGTIESEHDGHRVNRRTAATHPRCDESCVHSSHSSNAMNPRPWSALAPLVSEAHGVVKKPSCVPAASFASCTPHGIPFSAVACAAMCQRPPTLVTDQAAAF